jgi:hypothetical protein
MQRSRKKLEKIQRRMGKQFRLEEMAGDKMAKIKKGPGKRGKNGRKKERT